MTLVKALVTSAEVATAKNGNTFLRIGYNVKEGNSIVSKSSVYFDNGKLDPSVISGQVCMIDEQESTYQGKPSSKIASISACPPGQNNPDEFVKKSVLETKAMWTELHGYFNAINVAEIKGVVTEIVFNGHAASFEKWPAARGIHHAFEGGLLQHTLMMLRIAGFTMQHDVSYQKCDKGIVYAAIMLHDVGKVYEYDVDPVKGVTFSMLGSLLGHIVIADELIVAAANSLGYLTKDGPLLHLRHCVLSHHSKLEWGSPVTPKTIEANLVHLVDMIDGKGQACESVLEGVEPGGESAFNKGVGGSLFKL